MKKPYNEDWIENLGIQNLSAAWLSKKLITPEQLAAVKASFPEMFYRPGLFVKIGLFFFALIACSFFSGFISIFFLDGGSKLNTAFVSVICLLGFLFFLEYLIKTKNLFHSGVDNALLYSAMGAAVLPFFIFFDNLQVWQYCTYLLIILTASTLRYADLMATFLAYVVLFTLVANLLTQSAIGKAILPFVIMILSAGTYFLAKNNRNLYYIDCRKVFEVLSLLTFYLGGNYFVVREGNALLAELDLAVSPQIPFAPLFYFFTLVIPIAYVFVGLTKKDRILFIIGLVSIAFSIYTYRSYFSSLSVAQELAVAGMIMTVLAVTAIRYFHTTKHGLTDEPDGKRKFANLETIIVAQNLGQVPHEKGVEFGGGNFGGGGAGEVY